MYKVPKNKLRGVARGADEITGGVDVRETERSRIGQERVERAKRIERKNVQAAKRAFKVDNRGGQKRIERKRKPSRSGCIGTAQECRSSPKVGHVGQQNG